MIRIAFVIGGYPPQERKRRADAALAYSSEEVRVGIVNVKASPYFYGMTPAARRSAWRRSSSVWVSN